MAEVVFSRSGVRVQAADGENLLELAERHGVKIPSLCRGGTCGTCKVPLKSGPVDLEVTKGLSKAERLRGVVLACSSKVRGDLVVDV